jgi:sec-independent protein translocase protein TatA
MPILLGWTSGYELIIIAGIALLLFGHRLPSVMRSLGSGINEFKKGMNDPTPEPDPSEPSKVEKS